MHLALAGPDQLRQVFNDTDAEVLWLIIGAPENWNFCKAQNPRWTSRSFIRLTDAIAKRIGRCGMAAQKLICGEARQSAL